MSEDREAAKHGMKRGICHLFFPALNERGQTWVKVREKSMKPLVAVGLGKDYSTGLRYFKVFAWL